MGNLVWHEYARYVTLTASVYTVWAGFFGLIYRKFFWDFVNGTIRSPGGLQPAPQDAIFISVIVKAPIVPIISMILGVAIIALEYPAPFFKGTSIHRSFILRIVGLILQAFFAVLFYQFELRHCPALLQKPPLPSPHFDPPSVHLAPDHLKGVDPFLPPYNPQLYVGELKDEEEGIEYVILLNKYSVVPNHFLMVTKEYQSQATPLLPADLVQAYFILLAARKQHQNYFMIYNCGEQSGASQPHKHLQFIPIEDEEGPPIERAARAAHIQAEWKPFSLPNLPFAHHIRRLSIPPSASRDEAESVLATAFLELLDLAISTVRHIEDHPVGMPSYNVVLTPGHLFVSRGGARQPGGARGGQGRGADADLEGRGVRQCARPAD
ncbi:hypothetical protein EWM64_g3545 [Hericium alpestre]|uniref:HIT domain-containing protein n=1 Tax=Hericium alpestre TaxID=135208 RepID=A0A4Z0A2D9_9AGAM|nr:hypothetical protein EWM64_g3545 [Hericium alpestre]